MKLKRLRIYLVFWFKNKAPKQYQKLSGYDITKFGDEYLKIAYTEYIDKKYIDFDGALKEFLKKSEEERALIEELVNSQDGVFNIEIVPEVTPSSFPPIVLNSDLISFINALKNKFGYIEFDTYIT